MTQYRYLMTDMKVSVIIISVFHSSKKLDNRKTKVLCAITNPETQGRDTVGFQMKLSILV